MKHTGWFHLVLKGIGVVLILLAVPEWLGTIASYIRDVRAERALIMQGLAFGPTDTRREFLINLAPSLFQIAIGAYLVFGGRWLVNVCIPPNRRYCCECGYDLSGLGTATSCAECGAATPDSAETA
jgi:hypothetical protein